MFLWYMLSLSFEVSSLLAFPLWILTLICSGLITSGKCCKLSNTSETKLNVTFSLLPLSYPRYPLLPPFLIYALYSYNT